MLKPFETEPPEFLIDALNKGNRLQDLLTSNFKEGDSGNTILKNTLDQAKSEGLRPSVYTHPLGSYGHSSGPTIGNVGRSGRRASLMATIPYIAIRFMPLN